MQPQILSVREIQSREAGNSLTDQVLCFESNIQLNYPTIRMQVKGA